MADVRVYGQATTSGAKYKWAIAPMKSSSFYENFRRTHIDA